MSSGHSGSKALVTKTIQLMIKHEWLKNRGDKLTELVDEFGDDRKIQLIFELIDRFLVVDHLMIGKALDAIADQISEGWKLPENSTQIVATSFDEFADSGQAVLHALKPTLAKRKLAYPLINLVGKSTRKLANWPNVVLVDEFSGTGKTIVGRIEYLRADAEKRGAQLNVHVALIACMKSAKAAIEQTGVAVYAHNFLGKGISDYHDGEERTSRLDIMDEMEASLAQQWRGKPLPKLGYGEAEALYAAEAWNVPNSVFPVFWWPKRHNESDRSVLFSRMEP